jgi:hypothetical protein
MSRTRSPGPMAASSTRRAAQRLSSRWYPHHVESRPDTADHDHCHARTLEAGAGDASHPYDVGMPGTRRGRRQLG